MYLTFSNFLEYYLDLNDFKVIEDKKLFYLWKPAGIPSSFGKDKSVLDLLEREELDLNFIKNQKSNFTKEQEYGLLNRLDNATSGFLYFAKNKDFYDKFKKLQKEEKIEKVYYAKVTGDFNFQSKIIDFPIMHKNKTKMIAIKNKTDIKKGRGKQHFVKTYIEKIFYDKNENTTWLKVIIKKGIRHQIRCHLASVGFPIEGDDLYGGEKADKLYLFSVGIGDNGI